MIVMKEKAAKQGKWVTRISKESERRVYFYLTMGMIGLWLLHELFRT